MHIIVIIIIVIILLLLSRKIKTNFNMQTHIINWL